MNPFASFWSWLRDDSCPTVDRQEELVVRLQDVRHRYTPLRLLGTGDTAELHLASIEGEADSDLEAPYLLKVARLPDGNARLNNERKRLTTLLRAAGSTTYRDYLPALVDSFATAGPRSQRINVFRWQPGLFTLEQVHAQHPSLDGRHLGWIFNRLLTVLGFCQRQHIVHGAVLPCHVLLDAASHGLQLVGWGQSVAVGQTIRTVPLRYRDWYPVEVQRQQSTSPATDLFLAVRCLIYLAGGDPVANEMPESVPASMQRFLKTCLLESPSMRPDDAWEVMEDFGRLLHTLYGSPKFHVLTLT